MKKLFILLAILLPLSLGFVSCSSNDDVTEITEADIQNFQGTWDIVKTEPISFPGQLKILVSGNELIMFQKLPAESNFREIDNYTYKITGNTLILTGSWSDDVEATVEILALSASTAKIKITDLVYNYDTYTAYLTKAK